MRAAARPSGVMALIVLEPIVVDGSLSVVLDGAKDILVCRQAFVSLSFAGVTFVCLAFSPRRGEE